MIEAKLRHVTRVFRNPESVTSHMKSLTQERKKYVVEFSSPNIAKPFHFGHLRSTIIGNFIANLLASLDHRVVRINYLGDFGTQFGLLSLGFDMFGCQDKLLENPCEHLLQVYVRINAAAAADERLRQEGKDRFRALECSSDERILRQWSLFRELSAQHYDSVYRRLGISFDHTHYESMYSRSVAQVVAMIREKGILHETRDGAVMIRLQDEFTHAIRKHRSVNQPKSNQEEEDTEDQELVPLLKKDGSSLYLSRDVAAAIDRKRSFDFDHMLYVVENGQRDHFVNLKRILKSLGLDWHE